jgi:hypothetical protein
VTSAGTAPAVRERVLASHNAFWKPEDFPGSPAAVTQALYRLSRDNELLHLRKGLYWRGIKTPLGMAPPRPGDVVNELVNTPGIGPAGPSAANLLGLSTQVPRWETIAIPRRSPRPLERVHMVSRAASTARLDEKLGPAEVALLEVLRDWGGLVEVSDDEAARIIATHLTNGTICAKKVARAAKTEPPSVRARLRGLLAKLGYSKDANVIKAPRSWGEVVNA